MTDDAELLRRYAETHAQDAFAELVRRQVDAVYSASLRRVGGDTHLAQDVTQQVFVALARKAAHVARHPVLSGWLYTTTRNEAANVVRRERRRKAREQEAHAMHEALTPEPAHADWRQVAPVLDAVIDELAEADRTAVLLRFVERRGFAGIGAALRVTEDAARMRVERALEKLRVLLARRGIASTSAALGIALAEHAVVAAPAGLAAGVTGAALAGCAASAISAGALGTILIMSKIKVGIAAALVLAVAVPAVVELRAHRALTGELSALRANGTNVRAVQQEALRLTAALATAAGDNPDFDELARLRKRVAQLAVRPPGVVETEFRPASTWRNVGRATAEAANETFHWALHTDNIAAVTGLITFDDDTPENRASFLAKFPPSVLARYPTPELIVAAAFFGAGTGVSTAHNPRDAFQVISVRPDDRPGMTNVAIWYSLASGREWRGGGRWLSTPTGFVLQPTSLTKDARAAVERFNPLTGELIPRPPLEIDPATGRPIPAKK